ncbi:hypothetical protein [Bifidobacterium simiarum]|uniref:hypothetical protein n=1 Tax=Bifidobacterium simiarum TaxID=2045441 RepID=UPI0013FD373A|nr:hypothetical protein [Bifidobacterium simiarum]MBT1166189.1 hypothetical protein [Bifidobacterium simiarum]
MSTSLIDIQLAERRYDQLAADMIALLRANGDDGADFRETGVILTCLKDCGRQLANKNV